MAQWTIEAPTSLDFDDVTGLRVRLIAGSVAVLATSGRPSLDVRNISGDPLTVTRTCPVQLGVVSATAVMSGIGARAAVKSVSGGITLDGVTGEVDANTVSGAVEAQGLTGKLTCNTVSGDLTVADGWLERLDANAVSGDVTADLDLDPLGGVHVTTVSGEVTLRLPADADARVSLHSMSGDVRSEFTELSRLSAPASRTVSGSLGAGSGHVSVTTMSGRVMLLRRAGRARAAGEQPDNESEMEGEAS